MSEKKKLSTKNVDTDKPNFVPKTLLPGNTAAKIHSIKVEKSTIKVDALNIVLNIEGPDLGKDFEGFFIDKDDKTKGRHKGQVARLRADQWPFSEFTTKKNVVIERDDQMMKWLKNFCMAICAMDWWDSIDEKYDTIEQIVEALNKAKPFAKKVYNFCIAGKIYKNKEGYDTYDLFLPKFDPTGAGKVPIEMTDLEGKRLIKFNEAEHVIRDAKPKNVSSFSDAAEEESQGNKGSSSDFDLDEEEDK